MNLLDLFRIKKPEMLGLFEDFVADNPILPFIPTQFASATKIKILRNQLLAADAGRLPGATVTAADYINLEKLDLDLIIRTATYALDNYEMLGVSEDGIADIQVAKAQAVLNTIGNSLNNRIINGTGGTTDIMGLNQYCLTNSLVETYGTNVTDAATARAFMEKLRDALRKTQERATHIITGTHGVGLLERVAEITEQRLVTITDPLGRNISAVSVLGKTLPIITAGYGSQTAGTQSEVVTKDGSNDTLFYLVDFSGGNSGVELHIHNVMAPPVETGAGRQYTIEQFQGIAYKTKNAVCRLKQRVA